MNRKMTSGSQPRLYIDTNIFLDHLLGRKVKSSQLIREIANGRFEGFTSHFTLSELAGVLKELGVPRGDINKILIRVQEFPNIQIVFHDYIMFLDMPENILNTCVQCRDALHFMAAKYLAVDKIVTRDKGFKSAIDHIIPCVTPEQLLSET
ncbi:MAG: type II toxin-antitoxin system VapC family toxin [Candidatus Bathyarchaeia archaeon]